MLWFLSLFFCLGNSQNVPPYKTFYYKQTLDHFDPQNTNTFQQRYLVYDGAWKQRPSDPIFFYAGNEGDIVSFYNNTGLMFDIAPQFDALVIFCEHRYYGETHPFGNDFSAHAMRYLTIENAIADYAQFMTDIKSIIFPKTANAPVVVFGGSYGGVLAALCRIHYPAIFDMSLAASAPIPQTLNTVNSTIFFELVTNDYYNVDPSCPNIVREGYAQVLNAQAAGNYDLITKTFKLCSPVKNDNDVTYLNLWSRNGFLTMAMVDYPYAADFLGSLPANPVNVSCDLLLQYKENPMNALAVASGMFYNASAGNSLTCFDIYSEYIECADQTGCGLGTDATAWDYQMCTEIVYAVDANNVTDMFIPRIWEIGNLTAYCQKKYGVTPDYEWMQIWFPLDVKDATSKVIFSNGLLDPWHGGGYLEPLGPDLPAVIIPSGAHHLDLRGKNPKDPPDVTQARQTEVDYITKWLNELRS